MTRRLVGRCLRAFKCDMHVALRRRLHGTAIEQRDALHPRRLTLERAQRDALAPLSLWIGLDGPELLLVPPYDAMLRAYGVRIPPDLADRLLPFLERAARELLPLVAADGDAGPLKTLIRDDVHPNP